MYSHSYALVKLEKGLLAGLIRLTRGLRQCSILSPIMYDNFTTIVTRTINGGIYSNIRDLSLIFYEDDVLLISLSLSNLQANLDF